MNLSGELYTNAFNCDDDTLISNEHIIYIYRTYKLEGNDRAGVFLLLVYIYK